MATSPLEAFIRSDEGVEFRPYDAVLARDVLVNNASHLADSHGAQVLVKWIPTHTSFGRANTNSYLASRSSPTADSWFRCGGPFGPYSLKIRPDGSSYRVRVRVAASGSTSGDLTLRIVLAPLARGEAWLLEPGDHVYETELINSTSAAWYSGVSLGSNGWTTMCALSPVRVVECLASTSTLTGISGTPVTIQQTACYLHVFMKTTDGATVGRLQGLIASQWIGD